MAEGSKVRLVRCPKCQNVLPELPDYSVYECGGCGTVLRAKKKLIISTGQLEKPGKERVGEELESLPEKEGGTLGDASEIERDSDEAIQARRRERFFRERTPDLVSTPLPRKENKEASTDNSNRNVKEQNMGYQSGAEKGQPLKHPIDKRVRRDDDEMSTNNRSESVNSSIQEMSAQSKNSAGSLRSKVTVDQWGLERDGLGGGNRRMSDNQNKFSTLIYSDEGPSNYHLGSSSYGRGKLVNNYNDQNGPDRVAYVEQDRAELLRKLDELKEQLNRSSGLGEKQRERTPADGKTVPPDPYRSRVPYNVSMPPITPDKHGSKPPYFKQYLCEPVPYANSYDMDMHNFYIPPKHAPNEIPPYEDPFQPQMPRLHSHQLPHQYWHQPPHDYFLGQYMDFGIESVASYPHEHLYHQSACSCFRCYSKNWHVPSQVPPSVFGNRKFPKDSTDSNFNLHVSPVTFGPKSFNPQALHSRNPQPHARWPTDIDSDIDGFHQSRPRRMGVAHRNVQLCHPISGGAPFITCYNCFELLKLPRKLRAREKNQQKLRCGVCSTVLLFRIENKRLIISVPVENKQISAETDGGSSGVSKEILLSSDVCLDPGGTECSDDFDNVGYDFPLSDFKDNIPSEDLRLNVRESEKGQGLTSSPSISSEEEESLDSVIVQRDVSNSFKLPTKHDTSPTFQSLPFHEHKDDVSSTHAVNRCGEGNGTKWTDQGKIILDKSTSEQNSVKDVSTATEMEVPSNEYLNAGLSHDSVEASEEEPSRITKGRESFLVGLIKKSFRDFSRSNQCMENEKSNVLVNGKPIPDWMVKKAEKLAGPIQPGDYWYDFRAGFWGVMGQSCLGIIPPFIEEFNYPMPENCAAGNTGVFVNGRELNQKDLDLLASRGLPTTREKFYIIEISGKVLDEDSGEELNGLGKLAPTVLKAKRGFGMRFPRKLV